MSYQLEVLLENANQWNTVSAVSPGIQRKEIKPFVLLALKELEGNPDSRTSSLINANNFAAIRSIVRYVVRIRSVINEQWNPEDLQIFLDGLRFSPECIPELTTLLCSESVYDNIPKHLRIKPGLVSMQWKIDLSLCQANIKSKSSNEEHSKEILRRDINVILVIELTDSATNTYRLSMSKFHELRYIVANALKNMIVLEKRKCMRKD